MASRERQIGWAGSAGLHALLLLLFFFLHVPDVVQKQEFVEVSWGATAVPRMSTSVAPTTSSTVQETAPTVQQPTQPQPVSQPVLPPERRTFDLSDEVVHVPKTDKMDVPERGSNVQTAEQPNVGERETRTGQELGERERTMPGSQTGTGPGGTSPLGSIGVGADVDRGGSYSVHWLDGGSRRLSSFNLPGYPEGVNVEAQVQILTVVMPDGSVKAVSPAQKAHPKLEEVAMKEVRQWRFEPLRSTQPQLEQNAVIIFLFKLK
jgi:outer membrane biosynthesis protein TonB